MKSKNEIIFFKSENEMVEYALSQYTINQDNPFYFVDLSFIEIQYNRFKSLLPNVIPYYSVKANNDPEIIKEMAHLGAGFDCASEGEIQQVLSLVNVEPQKIIFANPSKIEEHILLAKKCGIKRMTFDSVEELEKIKIYYPEAELILRITVNDKKSIVQLSTIFGAPEDTWETLVVTCKNLNLNLIGVTFHIGSLSSEPGVFYESIKNSKVIFDIASRYNINLTLLDLGGGFPSVTEENEGLTFSIFADYINKGIKDFFSNTYTNIEIIAEPGRYICSGSIYFFLKIINRKIWKEVDYSSSNKEIMKEIIQKYNYNKEKIPKKEIYYYYINETTGLCLNGYLYEKNSERPHFFKINKELNENNQKLYPSSIFGFSSLKNDTIFSNIDLPLLDIGTPFYLKNQGAYSISCSGGVRVNGVTLTNRCYYFKYLNYFGKLKEKYL